MMFLRAAFAALLLAAGSLAGPARAQVAGCPVGVQCVQLQTFVPVGEPATLAASVVSNAIPFPAVGQTYGALITNNGSVQVNVVLGTSTVVATPFTGTPIAPAGQPGSTVYLPQGSWTYIAAITGSSSATLTIASGTGAPLIVYGGGSGGGSGGNVNLTEVGGGAIGIGQALKATSLPVVLPSDQTVNVAVTGTPTVAVGSGTLVATQATGSNLHVDCDNCAIGGGTAIILDYGGTNEAGVNASHQLAIQPPPSLPLPANAAQETGGNLAAVATSTGASATTLGTLAGAVASGLYQENVVQLGGVALGAPTNYGTAPGAIKVQPVNAFVTNTVPVTESGTWTVTGTGGTFPVTGSVTVVQPTGTNLHTVCDSGCGGGSGGTSSTFGAAFPATGTAIGASDGTNMQGLAALNYTGSKYALATEVEGTLPAFASAPTVVATQPTGSNLHVVCDSGCSSSTAPADEAAFTFGTTSQSPVGGVYQTTATANPLTTGQMGAFQVTAQRALFTNLRSSTGIEEGNATTPLQVSLANTGANATPVVATVSQPTAASLNATVVGTGTFAVQAAESGTWTVTGAGGTFPVTGTFWQTTQPVSAASLPLPSGAATAANQEVTAAGTTAASAQGVQGVTGGVPVPVSGTFWQTTQPVSLASLPTGAVTQSGTWTVQPGNTPNSTAWLVTGTGGTFPVTGTFWQTTQPVSAASLPLPSGAATLTGQTNVTGSAAAGTAAADSLLAGLVYNSTPLTLTNTQQASLQGDANGYLEVNVKAGGAGGTSSSFGSVFPATGTAIGASDGTNMRGLTGINYTGSSYALATEIFGTLPAFASTPAVTVSSGSVTVVQPTAANLNATVVGTGTLAVQAAESGTWTVQPGNTANTTAWLVTGTGGTFPVTGTFWQTTQPVSLASLPAVTGTVTANQGTAGAASWLVAQPNISATGQTLNSATLNASVSVAVPNGMGLIGWTVSGLTASGATLTSQRSNDGGNTWSNANTSSLVSGNPSPTVTTDGQFAVATNAATNMRLLVSVVGTGTITISYNAAAISSGVQITSSLPGGPNTIGAVTQASGPWTVAGAGTAGTPGTAVLTVQGVSGGTAVPVSGTISVTNLAQGSTTSGQTGNLIQAAVLTTPPTYTTAQTSPLTLTTGGALRVDVASAAGGIGVVATSTAPVTATNTAMVVDLRPDSPGIITLGPAAVSGSLPITLSSQYPTNATTTTPAAITASATGTTGVTTATLAATSGKTTFICGFTITADATALATGTATVAGVITGTLSYLQSVLAATNGVAILSDHFNPCVPASAANTAITVNSIAAGTGGSTAVVATGYQL